MPDLEKNCLQMFSEDYIKRALGPWVAHLRMTNQWSGTICEILEIISNLGQSPGPGSGEDLV